MLENVVGVTLQGSGDTLTCAVSRWYLLNWPGWPGNYTVVKSSMNVAGVSVCVCVQGMHAYEAVCRAE